MSVLGADCASGVGQGLGLGEGLSRPRGDWEGVGISYQPFVNVIGAGCATREGQDEGLGEGLSGAKRRLGGGREFCDNCL